MSSMLDRHRESPAISLKLGKRVRKSADHQQTLGSVEQLVGGCPNQRSHNYLETELVG